MANIWRVDRTNNKVEMGTTGTTINIDSHTASKTLALDASKNLESIQDLRTSASPIFAGLTLTGNITMPDDGWIGRSSSHCMLFDDTLTEVRFQSQLVSAYFEGEWNVFELQNFYTGVGSGPSYNLYRARGTQASPTTVVDGDVLGRISVRGYDGDTYENACLIKFWVDDTVSDGIVPSKMGFYTTDSAGVMDDRLMILGDGSIGIGTFTPDTKLQVVGNCKFGDDNTNYMSIAADGSQSFTGTARIDWTKITANGVTIRNSHGTTSDGVSDLQTAHDGNVYTLSEESGETPGMDIEVDFTGVTAFNWVQILARYEQATAGHGITIMLEITPFNGSAWHRYDFMQDQGADLTNEEHSFFIPDDSAYINSGVVKVRFVHEMIGTSANHDLVIDTCALYQ